MPEIDSTALAAVLTAAREQLVRSGCREDGLITEIDLWRRELGQALICPDCHEEILLSSTREITVSGHTFRECPACAIGSPTAAWKPPPENEVSPNPLAAPLGGETISAH